MAYKQNSRFSITINPFSGEDEYLEHFFTLVKDNAKINKWSNDQTILFLKSKLMGAALKFYLESPDLIIADKIEVIEEKFKDFFIPKTKATLVDFNNLKLETNESIKHFAHRLQVITSQAYQNISDEKAINTIKFNKFISALTPNLRIKLREENIENFTDAVKRAQALQEILQNELSVQPENSAAINNISSHLADLATKVNALTISNNKSNSTCDNNNSHNKTEKSRECCNRRDRGFKTRSFGRNHSSQNRRQNFIKCQICGKSNHTADKCFKYVNLLNYNQNRFRRFSTRRNFNRNDSNDSNNEISNQRRNLN